MIKNHREYAITRAQLRRLERALKEQDAAPAPPNVHPLLVQSAREALAGEIDALRRELAEYEHLRDGRTRHWSLASLGELPETLIRSRIAQGMTQQTLAQRLQLPTQQIQRYEATLYSGANLERLQQVAAVVGLRLAVQAWVEPDHPAVEVPSSASTTERAAPGQAVTANSLAS